jgi:hypothetical protein
MRERTSFAAPPAREYATRPFFSPLIAMAITKPSAIANRGAHAKMTRVSFHEVRKPIARPAMIVAV